MEVAILGSLVDKSNAPMLVALRIGEIFRSQYLKFRETKLNK